MLKTKVVGKYTVSQIGALEGSRLRLFHKQIAPIQADIQKDTSLDETERQARCDQLDEWATVAACTFPLITREEYLTTPYAELREIVEAFEEVNGDMAASGEVQSKKKHERKVPKSINE